MVIVYFALSFVHLLVRNKDTSPDDEGPGACKALLVDVLVLQRLGHVHHLVEGLWGGGGGQSSALVNTITTKTKYYFRLWLKRFLVRGYY